MTRTGMDWPIRGEVGRRKVKKKKQKIKSINYVIQKANADQITSELLWMENDSQDQVYDHHLVVVNNQVCMYNGAA